MNTCILQENARSLWIESKYSQSIQVIEEAIQTNPDEIYLYWYLGLAYFLQDDEETAQLIWLSAIAEQENSDETLKHLAQVLMVEAQWLTSIGQIHSAWAIHHYIRECVPQDLTNLFLLINLSIQLEEFTEEFLAEAGVIEILQSKLGNIESELLTSVLKQVLEYPAAETLSFTEACLPYFEHKEQWVEILNTTASMFAFERRLTKFAIALIELCLKYEPNNEVALGYLPRFHTDCQNFTEAIQSAKNFYSRSKTLEARFFANCVLLQALMRQGDWQEIPKAAEHLKVMTAELIATKPTQLSLNIIRFLIVSTGVFLYLKDDPQGNRLLQNQAGQVFLSNIKANAPSTIQPISTNFESSQKRLRIGYIASTLRNHSVGWLSRWLFQHHNREEFEVFIYLAGQRPKNAFFETWFAPQVDQFRYLTNDIEQCVQLIREDNIDVLVDLDSATSDQICTIMALKPAPIQASWLGYDASGLPTIDYYIADSYVLPSDAQKYYVETIWRLPRTYIAVDGFEIGVPTLRRSDLEIPEDAIVYWSSQAGLKRNPATVRLQMRILREVPNSYFLIKGIGDPEVLRNFFEEIAKEEGVDFSRLKFLPMMENEYIHRANIQLADIVLDTYPYNGATTTLETLWVGVPLVTLVGEQFAARNSYAFLMNVGVTEGIAWTEKEYVEWGIRFGIDEQLREQVVWKLRQSRKNSPLWDARQFTRDMEDAYRAMVAKHIQKLRTITKTVV
jgi:predicted O-linked N-acetylglucosamine transferase (SPINDLY family)